MAKFKIILALFSFLSLSCHKDGSSSQSFENLVSISQVSDRQGSPTVFLSPPSVLPPQFPFYSDEDCSGALIIRLKLVIGQSNCLHSLKIDGYQNKNDLTTLLYTTTFEITPSWQIIPIPKTAFLRFTYLGCSGFGGPASESECIELDIADYGWNVGPSFTGNFCRNIPKFGLFYHKAFAPVPNFGEYDVCVPWCTWRVDYDYTRNDGNGFVMNFTTPNGIPITTFEQNLTGSSTNSISGNLLVYPIVEVTGTEDYRCQVNMNCPFFPITCTDEICYQINNVTSFLPPDAYIPTFYTWGTLVLGSHHCSIWYPANPILPPPISSNCQ